MEQIVVIRMQPDQANSDNIDSEDRSTREQAPSQLSYTRPNPDHLVGRDRSENGERYIVEGGAGPLDHEGSRPVRQLDQVAEALCPSDAGNQPRVEPLERLEVSVHQRGPP